MKLLVDYKEDELVKLSDEEKQTLFLLECAERGVPLPDTIPEYLEAPEEREDLKEDAVVYSISGGRYSSDKFYFNTLEEAEAVAALIRKTSVPVASTYQSSKSIYYLGEEREATIEIETIKVYSANKYAKVKEEIAIYSQNEKRIKSNNSRRQEIMDKQSKVMDEIDDAITEANKNITRLGELKRIFEQYKKMANDDHEVAVRFLLNAHYSEIFEYEDDKLPRIGITKQDVDKYIENSKKEDEDEE